MTKAKDPQADQGENQPKVELPSFIERIIAPNPGPYTHDGTNTYIVGEQNPIIIDPGPNHADHLDAIIKTLAGREPIAIVLTHTHVDHSALAPKLSESRGNLPLWFGGPHRLSRPLRDGETNPLVHACDWNLEPDKRLNDGDHFFVDGIRLDVLATPGHCANHISFDLPQHSFTIVGDHVMGWSSTLVGVPDGSMQDYFTSLDKIAQLGDRTYLPGHGPFVPDGRQLTRDLKRHRQMRNNQIVEEVKKGAASVNKLADRIYPHAQDKIRHAAILTLTAHVEYLAQTAKIAARFDSDGAKLSPL